MTYLPSHNNSMQERSDRRQNWKENMQRKSPAIDTPAAHTKFDKQAAAFIAANRVDIISSTETRVYTGAGKTHFTVYQIKGAFKCECRDQEAHGFCSHEKAAAAHAALLDTPAAPDEPATICLNDRLKEFHDATKRADAGNLEVFPDWERNSFVVVNHDHGTEYRVTLRLENGKILGSCECPDFKRRRRICKHQAAAYNFAGDPADREPAETCGCRFEPADRYRECCSEHLPAQIETLICGCVRDLTAGTVVQCEECEWDYEYAWQHYREGAYA